MKRIILLLIILLGIMSISYAATMTLEYDGKVHTYTESPITLILNGEKFIPTEGLMPPVIIEDRTLVPVREVFEKLGGDVLWNASKQSVAISLNGYEIFLTLDSKIARVNNKEIELDVPAKLVNDKTMVPVRFISEQANLEVDWDGFTSTVTIAKKQIVIEEPGDITLPSENETPGENEVTPPPVIEEPVEEKDLNLIQNVEVDTEDKKLIVRIHTEKQVNVYNDFTLKEPNRIIIDIPDSKFDFALETIEVADTNVQKVRFGEQEDNINRIVIDVMELGDFEVEQNEERTQLNIIFDKTIREIEDITFSTKTKKTEIMLDGEANYTVRLDTASNKVIVTLKNTILGIEEDEMTLKDTIIKKIEYIQKDVTTVQVDFELKSLAEYTITEKDGVLAIKFTKPGFKEIAYSNKADIPVFTLMDVELDDLTIKENKLDKEYIITGFNAGSGTLEIHDDWIKNIVFSKKQIIINGVQSNYKYMAKQKGDNVIITFEEKEESDKKIIVIDPGHGGSDPGAVNGTNYEKTFNLDISLRLYDLLMACGNVEVYMLRTGDTNMDRYDKVKYANNMDADLFVSVHNNSMENKSYDGTMVLYYTKDTDDKYGITSKEVAQIVKDELVSKLGTTNRGIVHRKDLVVLNSTDMPAILCEIAFISNESDLAKLKTEKFKQDAAQAICDGIQKVLTKMN